MDAGSQLLVLLMPFVSRCCRPAPSRGCRQCSRRACRRVRSAGSPDQAAAVPHRFGAANAAAGFARPCVRRFLRTRGGRCGSGCSRGPPAPPPGCAAPTPGSDTRRRRLRCRAALPGERLPAAPAPLSPRGWLCPEFSSQWSTKERRGLCPKGEEKTGAPSRSRNSLKKL